MSIMHDANHGSYTRNNPFKAAMSWALDLVGASSFMWRQQHVIGHHCFTNVDGRDPDIRVEDPDIMKLAPTQPTRWYHKYQRFYLPALYGLMTMKAIYIEDFASAIGGKLGGAGGNQIQEMTPAEKLTFWGFKALYFTYMWAIPLMFGPHGLLSMLALHVTLNAVNGYTLATIFQVAHVTDDVEYPQEQKDANTKLSKVPMGWAESQVRTAADFCVDSRFWMHLTGGLSHQIEHHLFPGVCHVHYVDIAPIVEKTCKEFDIPYMKYDTFPEAVQGHWRALDKFGSTKDALAAATHEMPR
jgi:fatty acid desaturase